jgi:hypothetical protein
MEANEARYAARRQFGNVSWNKQRSHENVDLRVT